MTRDDPSTELPPATRRALRMLQAASFTSAFDRLMIAPMLVLIAADLQRPLSEVSRAAAVYLLCYGLAQVCWAVLSDRLGRVRTMRAAMFAACCGGLASTAAPNLDLLVAARGVTGACFAAAIPSALVYIGDTVPATIRQAPLTDLMTSTALGITAATVSAGAVASLTSWRLPFAVTAVIAGVLTVTMRRMTEPALVAAAPVRAALHAVLADRWAQLVLLLAFVEGYVLLGPLTFLPAILESNGLSVTVAGALTACYGAGVMIFAQVVKKRSRRTAPAALIGIGGATAVAACLLLTVVHDSVSVIVATVMLSAAWAFLHSTMQTWATMVVPGARATMMSLFATSLFTGGAVGTALDGRLLEAGHARPVFLVTLLFAVPLAVAATAGRVRYARG